MTTLATPPETVDRSRDRLAGRLTGIGGILLVIWAFATIGIAQNPDSSGRNPAGAIRQWFEQHGVHYVRILAAFEGLGEIFMMLVFAGLIWHVFRLDRRGMLPWVVVLGAIQFCTMADSGYAAFYSFGWSAGMFHGFTVDPNAYEVATGTQFASLAYAQMGLGVALAAAAVIFLRSQIGARWLQYLGIVVGLSGLLLPAMSGFFGYFVVTNILRFCWLLGVSVLALRGRLTDIRS